MRLTHASKSKRVSSSGMYSVLTNTEASNIKKEISVFRKSFNDDLSRRNKILFGK